MKMTTLNEITNVIYNMKQFMHHSLKNDKLELLKEKFKKWVI